MAKKRRQKKPQVVKSRPNFPPRLNLMNRVVRDWCSSAMWPESRYMRPEERAARNEDADSAAR